LPTTDGLKASGPAWTCRSDSLLLRRDY